MPNKNILIKPLENCGDKRGDSFCVPENILQRLEKLANFHLANILPGAIRGNHYHLKKNELIVVIYSDSWSIGWQEKNKKEKQTKKFSGQGAMAVFIAPGVSHAIKNIGKKPLMIAACSDHSYKKNKEDIFKNDVL